MPPQNLLMQKLKPSEVSLEVSGKLTSSCLDYLIFLLNPQHLNLIHLKDQEQNLGRI